MIVQVKWNVGMKNGVFRPISRFISKTMQDMAVVTMEDLVLRPNGLSDWQITRSDRSSD